MCDKLDREIQDARSQVKVSTINFSYGELRSMYDSGELVIEPGARNVCQDVTKLTALLEHVMLGFPTDPINVTANGDGIWVADEISEYMKAVLAFYGDEEWQLSSTKSLTSLGSYTNKTLPLKHRRWIDRAIVYVNVW